MGGTGKSRVLYAVTKFFEYQNQSYPFIVVAPTGTAAALLSGSAYHSAFGINDMSNESQAMPSITNDDFRFVSIITAKNAQKDEINRLGCQKFAEETGEKLTDFYSEDSLKSADKTKRTKKHLPNQKIKHIDIGLQKVLWNLPHSSSSRPVAGKLQLCIGMPIMIKSNVATELCKKLLWWAGKVALESTNS